MVWWFIGGIILGYLLACTAFVGKIIGDLKYRIRDDDIYFYMAVENPDVGDILSKKYVVLKVDQNPSHE